MRAFLLLHRVLEEYITGVNEFIEFALARGATDNNDSIKCPCPNCNNVLY